MNAPEVLATDDMSVLSSFDDLDVIAAARTAGCVLFTGAAHAKGMALRIHSLSGWRWGSFVSIDCGASEKVLEQQLSDVLRAGPEWDRLRDLRPALTQDGTVFLYEVGKLSLALQARLREALESRVPGARQQRSRKRIMASTSEPLLDRVLAGTFDDRLFYRLNAIHFVVPAGAK